MALKARIQNGVVFSPYPSLPVPEMSLYQVVKQCLEHHGNRTAVLVVLRQRRCGHEIVHFNDAPKVLSAHVTSSP
ncbi:hypothetical protein HPB47_013644 [Ixodes persulcatus]|uniref:Uncharacterized protein n=1 Tax=Ixodes persulcatus TaxID=34615 RepID=A0AC60QYA6_IXOPE|nr:hypothetical protein HPB47_013644 [Ixodes persulcatus]